MPTLQYDPERLGPLRAATSEALRHLLATTSADPAAAAALRVAALVRNDLEHGWLPAIDRLVASDAMRSWTATGPRWAQGLSGRALGEELAARAEELASLPTPELRAELVDALQHHGRDEEAMATFLAALGPEVLLDVVVSAATGGPAGAALSHRLRDVFVGVAGTGGLAPGFGRRLVRAARTENEHAGGMSDGGLGVSFLFHGDDVAGAVVVEAIDEAILLEHEFATGVGGGPDIGAALWAGTGTNAAVGLWPDFDEPYRGDDLDAVDAGDPMYALLGQLARDGNGRAGRDVFTDEGRARYLFAERDVLADGGRSVVAAAATASAGRDIGPGAPADVVHDASLVASAFVNLFGAAHARHVDGDDRVATAAARIVGGHMYGVQHATGADSTVTDRDRAATLPAEQRDLVTGSAPHAAVAELANRAFDGPRPAAVFDPTALGEVLHLAARADAGVEVLRAGLSRYQQGVAAEVAARLAAAEIAAADIPGFLAEVMADSARLEGSVVARVGDEAARRGRRADAVVAFWIGAIGKGADVGSSLFGPGVSTAISTGADVAGHALEGTLADAEQDAARDSDARGELAGERLTYLWLRELQAAGLVDADLAPGILVDGVLPPYDDLVVALATVGPPGWEVTTVIQQFDESTGGVVDTDLAAMLEAMTATQSRSYAALG